MSRLPEATLFMLMSIDGKISTGSSEERDFDEDLPGIAGAGEGLSQYYDLEQETDHFSLNTGKVMAKVGWNEEKSSIERIPVAFIVIDNQPHLTSRGISNLLKRTEKLYIVTTNNRHPAYAVIDPCLEVVGYEQQIDFIDMFEQLKMKGVDKLTIQSGGEMNATLLRAGLINYISIVIAPLLVGGKDTPTLIDGKSLENDKSLGLLRPMKLVSADMLKDSYLHLRYKVLNDQQ